MVAEIVSEKTASGGMGSAGSGICAVAPVATSALMMETRAAADNARHDWIFIDFLPKPGLQMAAAQ